ncbi:hypothetical protein SDD30_05805 [Moorella naiadis]
MSCPAAVGALHTPPLCYRPVDPARRLAPVIRCKTAFGLHLEGLY